MGVCKRNTFMFITLNTIKKKKTRLQFVYVIKTKTINKKIKYHKNECKAQQNL